MATNYSSPSSNVVKLSTPHWECNIKLYPSKRGSDSRRRCPATNLRMRWKLSGRLAQGCQLLSRVYFWFPARFRSMFILSSAAITTRDATKLCPLLLRGLGLRGSEYLLESWEFGRPKSWYSWLEGNRKGNREFEESGSSGNLRPLQFRLCRIGDKYQRSTRYYSIRAFGHGCLPVDMESLKLLNEDLKIQCERSNKKCSHLMEQAVVRVLLASGD